MFKLCLIIFVFEKIYSPVPIPPALVALGRDSNNLIKSLPTGHYNKISNNIFKKIKNFWRGMRCLASVFACINKNSDKLKIFFPILIYQLLFKQTTFCCEKVISFSFAFFPGKFS